MSLGIRKIIIIGLIGAVFLAGNVLLIANWLSEKGVPEKANWLRENFLNHTSTGRQIIQSCPTAIGHFSLLSVGNRA